MLKLVDFIKANADWEAKLQGKPYCLKIKRKDKYILFMYSQKEYGFNSLNDVISMAEKLPFNSEGYVVVDGNWNRVKIKSPAYVAVHHLKNNGIITKSRIVSIIRKNESEEFLSYFPEYKECFDDVAKKIDKFVKDMNWHIEYARQSINLNNRKAFAKFAKTTKCPALMFNWYDKKVSTAEEWL